jgi:site-specific DNA recombinase
MRAVGYFRQASGSASNKRDALSLARQQRAFLDYCEKQGYEVAATFSEEPSKEDSSTGFAQLVDFLRQPEKGFVVVIANSPATLADEPSTAGARFLELESLGAKVQFIAHEGDGLDAILEAWSSGDAANMRDRVRTAMRRKAVRGEVLGRPPYGYKVGPRNRLDLVSDEAVVVRYIFRLYLQEGLGIRLIARRLNEEGLRTRRQRPWSMVSIRDILRNRAYLGTYQRLGVRVPGTHPALVSPDDFRKVQERLSDRRTNYSPRTVRPFLLSGLAICGNCGNKMIGVSRRQSWKRRSDGEERVASYRYYQCESRTNQGICAYHTHRAEELEAALRAHLADLDPRRLNATGDDAAVIAEWQAEARRLKERLQQLDKKIGRSLEDAAQSRITREKLRALGRTFADERLKAEDELRAAEWRAEHYSSAAERRKGRYAALERLASEWDSLPVAEHQELLRDVIDQVVVTDSGLKVILRP